MTDSTAAGAISADWAELTNWLSAVAPRSAVDVRPPSRNPANSLGAASNEPVLLDWFNLHDGQNEDVGGLVRGGWALIGAEACRAIQEMLLGANEPEQNYTRGTMMAGERSGAFLPSFWPVLSRGNGTFMFVDLGEGSQRGCVRQWARENFDQPAEWDTLGSMVQDTLQAGRLRLACQIVQGELVWDW